MVVDDEYVRQVLGETDWQSLLAYYENPETKVKKPRPIPAAPAPIRMKPAYTRLNEAVKSHVFGQDEAIDRIAEYVEVYQAGLSPSPRPAGAFLLLGPTGVGKTETCEMFAEAIHKDRRCVIRVNCGEFQQPHEIAKLAGAPPGYLGHNETTPILTQMALTNVVKNERTPLAIVLFDEIEKAHPAVYQLLLGILDKGEMRLGNNKSVQFRDTLIFFTSNLGARQMSEAAKGNAFNFVRDAQADVRVDELGKRAAKKHFSPEFMGRIDEVLVYKQLDRNAALRVAAQELSRLQDLIRQRHPSMNLFFSKGVAGHLATMLMTDPEYAGRNLKKRIQREIVLPAARMFMEDEKRNNRLEAILRNNKLVVRALPVDECVEEGVAF